MARAAEVVVVGGGVVGASVAWHLASRGCRDVLVLDRFPRPDLGSTGKATGGFRTQFASEVEVRLSLLAREKLLRFADETGVDPGFRSHGYLFLARDEEQLARLRSLRPIQEAAGLTAVRDVTPEEALRLSPEIRVDGVAGGAFCPLDGFMRPLEILRGYTEAAERLGVRFEREVEVTGVRREDRRVAGLETSQGPVSTRHVVNAAGAWAGVLAGLAGVDLPVRPVRRQVAITEPFPRLPEDTPMTAFLEDELHFRVRDGRVLLLLPLDTFRDDPFDTSFEPSWLDELLPRAHARVPCLQEAKIDLGGCWAGLYEMSPDRRAIVGRAPELEGFYLVNGNSGHGVMHSPALGQIAAELVLDGAARSLDIAPLRPTRFQEGDAAPSALL